MFTKRENINRSACLVLCTLAFTSATNAASVNLGNASALDWMLLSLGDSTVTINNESVARDFDELGNNAGADSRQVGIQGGGGKLQMSGGGYVGGPVRLSDGAKLGITDSNTIDGGIYGYNLDGDPKGNTLYNESQNGLLNDAASDATYFSGFYKGLTATNSSVTEITDSLTLEAENGQNILNLTKLELGGSDVLTLDGRDLDSSFIINIEDNLKLNKGRIELINGLTFDEVLFNVGGKVAFSGGGNASVLRGVVLALHDEIAISPGLIQGSLIGRKITLTSGADLDTPFNPVPEINGAQLGIALTLLLSLVLLYREREGFQA